MSVHVLSWAWRQDVGGPARKLVLLKLADSANDDGLSWPSVPKIARDVGLSDRAVQRHVAALEKAGIIARSERRRGNGSQASNCYQVVRGTVTPASPHGDASHPPTVTPASPPEPPLEPSEGPPPIAPLVRRIDHPSPATVARRRVEEVEAALASDVLSAFNEVFGTNFHSADWTAKIVMRVREHPDLTAEQHRAAIEANAREPWWEGAASPSVIYGNGALFERALLAGRGPRKLSRHLTPEEMIERARKEKADERE